MPKQVKAALTAALVVFVVAVTGGMAVGTIGLFGAGAGALGLATLSFATTLVTSLIGGMGSKGISASSGNFGTKIAQRNGIAPRQLIYGECRVGGTIVHMSTSGTDNNLLHMVIVLSGHEVEGLQSVIANDTTLTTSTSTINGSTVHTVTSSKYTNSDNDNNLGSGRLMRFSFEDGSQTSANGFAAAQCPSLTSTDKFLGCSYVYFQMVYDSEKIGGAIPNLAFVIRGKKVFDPRDSSTAYSTNPALIVRDYLSNTLYGLKANSSEINDATTAGGFGAAANICDQTVTLSDGSTTETRYTCNGFSNFAADGGGLMEALLSSCAGTLTYTNGKFNMFAGATQTPSLTITDDNLLAPLKINTGGGTGSLFNAIKPVFVDSAVKFQAADGQVYEDSGFLSADTPSGESSANYKKQLELQLPFTTSKTMAERLSRIALKSQRQTASVSVLTDLKFMQLQPGDWVYFTNERLSYNQKIFQVIGTNMEMVEVEGSDAQMVATRLELKETATSVFDFAGSDYQDPIDEGGDTGNGDNTISAPSGLSLAQQSVVEGATTKADIKVSWTNAANDLIIGTEIQYKLSTDSDYTSDIMVGKGVSTGLIPNVVVGKTYNVRLKHIASTGVASAYTSAVNITITSATAPSTPTNWSASSNAKFGIVLNWTNPPETNFRAVKIYRKTSTGTPTNDNNVVSTLGGEPSSTGRDFQNLADGLEAGTTYYFWIRSVNHLGVESAISSMISATFTAGPGDIGILSLADIDSAQDSKLDGVEAGATLGATAGTNLKDSGNNTLSDEDVRNSDLSVDFTGNTTFRIKKGTTVIDSQAFGKANVGLSDLDSLEPGTGTKLSGIEANATVGATAGTNLKDSSNNTLGDEDVRNDDLSLAFSGTNIQIKKGTTQIGSNVDAPDALKNAQVTLAKDGSGNLSLNNAGAGNVSFDSGDVGLGNVANKRQVDVDLTNAPDAIKNAEITSSDVVGPSGKLFTSLPESGATVGATAGSNLKDSSNNTLGDEDVKNDDLSLAFSGTDLQLKKGSTQIGSNLGAPNALKNDQLSISKVGGAVRLTGGSGSSSDVSFDNSDVGLGNVLNATQVKTDLTNAPDAIKNDQLSISKVGGAVRLTGGSGSSSDVSFDNSDVGLGNVLNAAQVKTDLTNAPDAIKNSEITSSDVVGPSGKLFTSLPESGATVGARADDNLLDSNGNDLGDGDIVTSQGTSNDTSNVSGRAAATVKTEAQVGNNTGTNFAALVDDLNDPSATLNITGERITGGVIEGSLIKTDELDLITKGTDADGTTIVVNSTMSSDFIADIGTGSGMYMGGVAVKLNTSASPILGASIHLDIREGSSSTNLFSKYFPIGIKEGNQYYDTGDQYTNSEDRMNMEFMFFYDGTQTLKAYITADSNSSSSSLNVRLRAVKFGAEQPNAFTFTDELSLTKASNTTTYETSNTVTLGGFSGNLTASVSGHSSAQMSVNSGTFTGVSQSVDSGDTIQLRILKPNTDATTRSATLNVGGVQDTYTIRTTGTYVPDPEDSYGCFPANTQILMADGRTQPIQNVAVGELVQTFNLVTQLYEPKQVEYVMTPKEDVVWEIRFRDGKVLKTTDAHPLLGADGKWWAIDAVKALEEHKVDCQQLKVGDKLLSNYSHIEILSIQELDRQTVYNLSEVVDNHNFIADGFVVHNVAQEIKP